MEMEENFLHDWGAQTPSSAFIHPAADRLFRVIMRINGEKSGGDLRSTIKDIYDDCGTCKQLFLKPFRLRESLPPEKISFNQELAIDIVWMEGRPTLNIVETHTHFKIRSQSRQNVAKKYGLNLCGVGHKFTSDTTMLSHLNRNRRSARKFSSGLRTRTNRVENFRRGVTQLDWHGRAIKNPTS